MSAHTKIEWTEATWNPVRGCIKISPGCKHCYAETFAERFRGVVGHPYERGFEPRLVPSKLLDPFRWTRSKMVFVNSMSDLFQSAVSDEYISAVASVMLRANWHTYQVLTKRADRMEDLLGTKLKDAAAAQHIWWGVSVEDKKYGIPRIEQLRRSAASVRFLSIEPLLEDLGDLNLGRIDWAIVGGESGRRARPIDPDWVSAIQRACIASGTKFFFKQWGGTNKKKSGRLLNGRTYDDMPPKSCGSPPSACSRQMILQAEMSALPDFQSVRPLFGLV